MNRNERFEAVLTGEQAAELRKLSADICKDLSGRMAKKKHKECFTCAWCCTTRCPNIEYDTADERFGYGIADDIGLKRVTCSKCFLNSYQCKDCYLENTEDCPEIGGCHNDGRRKEAE